MDPSVTPPAPTPPVSDNAAISGIINGMGEPTPPAHDLSLDFDSPNSVPLGMPAAPVPPAPTPPTPAPTPTPAPGIPAAPPAINPDTIPLAPVPPAPTAAQPVVYTQEQVDAMITAVRGGAPAPTPPAPPVQEEWKPGSWQEVEQRIEQRAREMVQAGFSEADAAARSAQEEQNRALAAADAGIEQSVAELEKNGFLPPVANPSDPNDPGRAARTELYSYALALGTDNLPAAAASLHTLHQSGYYYDRTKNAYVRRGSQSAAAQAPIAGAAPVLPAAVQTGPTMQDIATKSLSELSEQANQAFPLS